jgi:hypothetical protein
MVTNGKLSAVQVEVKQSKDIRALLTRPEVFKPPQCCCLSRVVLACLNLALLKQCIRFAQLGQPTMHIATVQTSKFATVSDIYL